ncbi:MAG: ABC transporter substrate-binding protein [Bacteroidota bacterium]
MILFVVGSLGIGCSSDSSSPSAAVEQEKAVPQRIVSLSGSITETLFALGAGDRVVGIDVTSTFPKKATEEIPTLGHITSISLEALLALQPDLVLYEQANEKSPLIEQLKGSTVNHQGLSADTDAQSPIRVAKETAALLQISDTGDSLANAIQQELDQIKLPEVVDENSPRILFIYTRGPGNMTIGGANTPADAIIKMAGGQNAASNVEGFKPLSTEGLVAAQPDYLLLFESGLASVGGPEELLKTPGMEQIPANTPDRVLAMDGLALLGFTPRLPETLQWLSQQIDTQVN